MKTRKFAAAYSIFMGVSMLGMWCMFYLTGGIPELVTKPAEIAMHLAAEVLTAVMLIIGGAGVLMNKNWGMKTYLVSMGMLLYTLIVSPGYYVQRGEAGFVAMFAAFFVLAVLALVLVFKGGSSSQKSEQSM